MFLLCYNKWVMKKYIKRLLIWFCIIIGIAIIFIGIYFLCAFFNLIYHERYNESKNGYKIVILGNDPKFPFGSEDIIIKVSGKNGRTKYKTSISNDGKALDDSNISVEWYDDSALVILSGEEQDNEELMVSFKDMSIKHNRINFEIKPLNDTITKTINEKGYTSEIISNIDIVDKDGNSYLNSNIRRIVISMKNDGNSKIDYLNDIHAVEYRNDKLTIIECPYNFIIYDGIDLNYNYYRYVISDKNIEYDENICK